MSNNQTYSKEFKENAVKQAILGGHFGFKETSVKMGIPISTLYGWKKNCANIVSTMEKSKNKSISNWTPQEKLNAIIETSSLKDNELGEYLRTHGLHSSDIENFKQSYLESFKPAGRPKLDQEIISLRKQKKAIDKDLKRTQRALAEQSARIILLKKSHEIWGDQEDDE